MRATNQEETLAIVNPHLPLIGECIHYGVETYTSYPAEVKMEHDSRAKASCIYSHMLAKVHEKFENRPDAKIIEHNKLYLLVIEDKIAIRFKKLDKHGKSSNYQTQQTKDFDTQLTLSDIQAVTNLRVGYILDPAGTTIETMHVVCPYGKKILWKTQFFTTQDTNQILDIQPQAPAANKPRIIAKEKKIIVVERS